MGVLFLVTIPALVSYLTIMRKDALKSRPRDFLPDH